MKKPSDYVTLIGTAKNEMRGAQNCVVMPGFRTGQLHGASIPESYVDAIRAAELLDLKPRRVLEMARAGQIPAYPLGTGSRKTWRFRLSEICAAISAGK